MESEIKMQNELLCVDDDGGESRWWCCKARWVPYVAANNTRDSAGGPYREAGAPYKDHGPPLSPHTRDVGGRLPEKTWEECTLLPKKPPSPKFSLLQYCLTMQIMEERILYIYSITKAMLVHDKSVPNTFLQVIGNFHGPWRLSAIKRSINLISEEELQPENGQVELQVELEINKSTWGSICLMGSFWSGGSWAPARWSLLSNWLFGPIRGKDVHCQL